MALEGWGLLSPRIRDVQHVKPSNVVSLVHLGCARNLIDSELILGRMAEAGLVVAGDPESAQTVVINTCSFIGPAREESEQTIAAFVEKKRSGELQHVVVAGCLVQRYKRLLATRFPEVDVFAEISDYRKLAKTIKRLSEGREVESYLEGPGLRAPERDGARLLATPGSYAYLRISHGCDHTCAFCAIPGIRGSHRSKRPADVLDEARELIDVGVRELVLVAEDSTAWGRDFGAELPDLVEGLAELDGEHRIRVMYAYPNRFPWRLTELLGDHPRVVPYLDIPIQHAATPVLRAMRRAGSGDQVRKILDRLRGEVPDITLRTTLLLGFPGETDADVEQLLELVRSYELGRLGAFTYSPEEDTPAMQLELPEVPEDVARARYAAVVLARDEVLEASQRAWIGRQVEVLVDEASVGSDPIAVARTAMDAPEVDPLVLVRAGELAVGQRLRVLVEACDDDLNLIATPCGQAGVGAAARKKEESQ